MKPRDPRTHKGKIFKVLQIGSYFIKFVSYAISWIQRVNNVIYLSLSHGQKATKVYLASAESEYWSTAIVAHKAETRTVCMHMHMHNAQRCTLFGYVGISQFLPASCSHHLDVKSVQDLSFLFYYFFQNCMSPRFNRCHSTTIDAKSVNSRDMSGLDLLSYSDVLGRIIFGDPAVWSNRARHLAR